MNIEDFRLDFSTVPEEIKKEQGEITDAMGRVFFVPEDEVVRIMAHEYHAYDIDVERCQNMVDICRWLFHLQGKK